MNLGCRRSIRQRLVVFDKITATVGHLITDVTTQRTKPRAIYVKSTNIDVRGINGTDVIKGIESRYATLIPEHHGEISM